MTKRQDNLPLIIFLTLFLGYFVFGSMKILANHEFMMVPLDIYFHYTLLLSGLGILFTTLGYLLFVKKLDFHTENLSSTRGALVLFLLYSIGWVLRFKLIDLGLYQKYGYLENYRNSDAGPIIGIFLQIQIIMLIIALSMPLVSKWRFAVTLIIVEAINSFVIGAKSAILFMIVYYFIVHSVSKNYSLLEYFKRMKIKLFASVFVMLPIIFFSSFVTPYAYYKGLMNSESYLTDIITNIPDFLEFVSRGEGELADTKYTSVRFAPVDPISAIVARVNEASVDFTYGSQVIMAVEMMIPKIIYPNKPDYFGEDIEEQHVLRHFNLPDDDIVGTVIFSGYATLGMIGVCLFMFFIGVFFAFCWNFIRKFSRSTNSFLRFLSAISFVFFIIQFLKVEQTLVTATLLNLRNLLFFACILLLVWIGLRVPLLMRSSVSSRP